MEQPASGPRDLTSSNCTMPRLPAELIYYETLGLCEKGEGAPRQRRPQQARWQDAGQPVRRLVAQGHPVGATGLAQVHELVEQLRGERAPRQVEGARIGMAENGGGYIGSDAAAIVISILEK
ncbi:MAG: hypothetical protein IPG43_18430 [Proteobacteria bacterium]|nr:hypothetical protein [Pseudomonadota bacterium]